MSAHAEFLRAASNNKDLASQLKADFRKASLSKRDFRMLEFVEKLTLFPALLIESDVKLVRQTGFSDSEILHIVLGSAHFNYLNRMADGLGIQFEYKSGIAEFKVPASGQPTESPGAPAVRQVKPSPNQAIAWIRFPETSPAPENADQPVNLYHVMGDNPAARDLARDWRVYQLTGTPALAARRRAELALFISALNRCDYSAHWFARLLRQSGATQEECDRLVQGQKPEQLAPSQQLFFEHAERLTQEPWTTHESHIESLRQAGMDDHGILQLTMLCSYLSFENRVVLGLGVALERSSH